MIERVDQLSAPPVVGRFYLVPTVRYPWHGAERDWPVMGPMHTDAEHLEFPHLHYHVDVRFVGGRELPYPLWLRDAAVQGAQSPLSYVYGSGDFGMRHGHPPVVYRRRKCRRSAHAYPVAIAGQSENFTALWQAYAGRQCKRGRAGWICPHRQFALGSIAPEAGIITCPLHGLRIEAASGVVIGEPVNRARANERNRKQLGASDDRHRR